MVAVIFSSLIVLGIIVSIAVLVITAIPLVSYLRQRRVKKINAARRDQLAKAQPKPDPIVVVEPPPPSAPATQYTFPVIPEMYRLPIREGTPDQIVIMIEPNEGPTLQQRNVQRLIAYLKEESSRNNAAIPAPITVTQTPSP